MKRFFRAIIIGFLLIFTWPLFIYKRYGNKKYKIENGTIIVANHYSNFDPFFIWLIYGRGRNIRFVTINKVKDNPFTRFICALYDCLYLDYETPNFGFFKECIKTLNAGGVICIFPEGVINPKKNGFFDFKSSFIYLARKTNAKILPLFIYPTLAINERTKLYIGDVITPDDIKEYDDMDCAAMYVQAKVMDYCFKLDEILDSQNKRKKNKAQ